MRPYIERKLIELAERFVEEFANAGFELPRRPIPMRLTKSSNQSDTLQNTTFADDIKSNRQVPQKPAVRKKMYVPPHKRRRQVKPCL